MKSFIEALVDESLDLSPLETLVILPTQRACQEYRTSYARKKSRASFLPEVIPVQALIGKLDVPEIEDDLGLLLRIYRIHTETFGIEDFGVFQAYGEQVLKDFSEIDRQLILPDLLFREISDLKELESVFAPDSEELMHLKNFWSEFLRDPRTPLQHSFLRYWKQLPVLYRLFNEELDKNGLSYEGKAWKMAVASPSTLRYFDKFTQVVFAGFYALNTTEEKLLDILENKGKLRIYRDADAHYVDIPQHEAGMFFRRGRMADAGLHWTANDLEKPKESYIVTGCTGMTALCFQLAGDLYFDNSSQKEKNNAGPLDAVVVLADESLLFTFLQHCDRLGLAVNPSMGFPLKHHPLLRVLHLLRQLLRLGPEHQQGATAHRLREEIASDPFLLLDNFGSTAGPGNAALPSIFQHYPSHLSVLKNELDLFLKSFHFEDFSWMHRIHQHLLVGMQDVCQQLQRYEEILNTEDWFELLLNGLEKVRIPFASREGIPVMGFLETRNLDFQRVYIAPLNEGSLPSTSASHSLIPYSLRKAYRLPCTEEQDAITAYHFYRLLQRAKHIRLYYNTLTGEMGGGERSRYLHQLHHEIITRYPPAIVQYLQQHDLPDPIAADDIIIQKTPEILDVLRNKYLDVPENTSRQHGFSASAINSYIACSLRFYFDQVANIRPEKESTTLSAGDFGNVLHKTMELAYAGHSLLDRKKVEDSLVKLPALIEEALKVEYDHPTDSGHDYLMKGVLTELVKRILTYDLEQAPVELVGLECKLSLLLTMPGAPAVIIKGIIDRVDIREGQLRILDYKTGVEKLSDCNDSGDLFTKPGYKLNLQLMLYVLLVRHHFTNLNALPAVAGIFKLREFDNDITWLNKGISIEDKMMEDFQNRLVQLIQEIFNPEIPFAPTSDVKRCKYCDYKVMCNRQSL